MTEFAVLFFIFVVAGIVWANVLYYRENRRREKLPEYLRKRLEEEDEVWRRTFSP